MTATHVGDRFDRLPGSEEERSLAGRTTREAVLKYFEERFGIPRSTFEAYTFWEKGKGKVWAFRSELPSPVPVEAMGLHLLRTRQRFWKPTTDGMQLFGRAATRNCLELSRVDARTFWRGETQEIAWDGEPGYAIVTHQIGGAPEPLGIGLIVDEELRSMIPKGRRRDLQSGE